jgi:hypothetical protein
MDDMAQAFFAQKYFKISCSSSGVNQIIAGQAGYKIRVLSYVLSGSAAVNAKWQTSVGPVDLTGLLYLGTDTVVSSGETKAGLFETNPGDDLSLNLSGAVPVGGHLTVAIIPAT